VLLSASRLSWEVLHQCGAHVRGSEWTEWNGGRSRRGAIASHRRLGADVQRVRTGGGVPAAVRGDSPGGGRRQSGALKLELRKACRPSRASPPRHWCLLTGWVIAMLPSVSAVLLWEELRRKCLPARVGGPVGRPRAQQPDSRSRWRPPRRRSRNTHPRAAILTLSVTVGTWIVNSSARAGRLVGMRGRIHAGRSRGRVPAWADSGSTPYSSHSR